MDVGVARLGHVIFVACLSAAAAAHKWFLLNYLLNCLFTRGINHRGVVLRASESLPQPQGRVSPLNRLEPKVNAEHELCSGEKTNVRQSLKAIRQNLPRGVLRDGIRFC